MGAIPIAVDRVGINMIARNAPNNVLGVNLYPGSGYNNALFYIMLANMLQQGGTPDLCN